MKVRNCPVCDMKNAKVIMRFTPELICAMNATYDVDRFKDVVRGKEDLLTYSQCQECGMIYCENVWNNETLRRVYEDVIIQEKSRRKTMAVRKRLGQVQNWKNVLTLLLLMGKKELRNIKIIDYGCGWGDLLGVIYCEGVEVLGYDKYVAKTAIPLGKKELYARSIEELKSFGPVDVLFMTSVLEHLQDTGKALRMAKSLLKRNGIIVIRVMDYRSVYIKKNIYRLRNNLPALSKNLNPIEHVNLYDYDSVCATLKKHDFKLLSTGTILRLSDFAVIPKGLWLIRYLNKVEKLSSRLIKGKELMITAYGTNM